MSSCCEFHGGAGAGERSVTLCWRNGLDNGVRRVPARARASALPDRAAEPFSDIRSSRLDRS